METSGRDGERLCACFVKQRRHVYVPPRIVRSKTSIPRVLYMPRNARSKTSILHVIFIHFSRQSLPMTLELSTRQLVHSPFHQPVSCGVVVCAITQIYQSDGRIPHTHTYDGTIDVREPEAALKSHEHRRRVCVSTSCTLTFH